jgi:glycosyltransferase involved in cell wall biosynthesis
VLISDDSDDGVAPDIERMAVTFGARYVRGPRRGLYANRNSAAMQCTGTHIRTMDDDHEFPPGHLTAVQAAVEDDPVAIWVMNERMPWHTDLAQALSPPPQLHPRGYSVTPPPGERIWSLSDGAAVFPRAVFDAGERYSEAFPMGAGYLEFGSRLAWRGYRIRHLESTYILHNAEERQTPATEWDLGSRLFAGWMHSFVYQPSLRNRALTLAEIAVSAIREPKLWWPAVKAARRAVRERRVATRGGS